jgi:hypothetical protein
LRHPPCVERFAFHGNGKDSSSVLLRVIVLAAAAAVVSACNGGTVDRHALTNDAATLDSVACEGALLARDVAQGKTIANYAREQAEELHIQSSNLADALAKRPTLASIEPRVRKKSRDAARIALILRSLQNHPSDRHIATMVDQQLAKMGGCT